MFLILEKFWVILYLQRNGSDFSVFLNTASEFDGSDSGARPDEAISWGKIRKDAKAVKVNSNWNFFDKKPSTIWKD